MADANIFQQYLVPPKSVADYTAEMDQADTRKLGLQQNALTLAAGRQKFDEGQQSSQRAAQVRAALMGLPQGATDDQRIQAMRATATPEGFTAADTLSKSLIDQRKGIAAASKDEADAAKTQLARDIALHDFHTQKLATVQTPEDAIAWAQEGKSMGLFSQPGQYERGVAMIQQAAQDPQAFAKWKAAAMQGGQSVTEQLRQQFEQAKQAEQVRQFGVTDQRIKAEGDANRKNQIRVQGMVDARAADKVPAGYRANPDGSLAFIPGGPADPTAVGGKAPTEFQGKSAVYGARAEQADKLISQLAGKFNPAAINAKQSVEKTWLIGGALGAATNKFALSEDDQKAEQAQRDFVNAVLRQESGAAIGASEFENAQKQYFPQPGDSPGVIAQKAANRKLAIKGFQVSAGKASFSAPPGAAASPALPAGWTVEVH